MTGLEIFERSFNAAHGWLDDIADELGPELNQQECYQSLKAVLHALRDNLSWDESAKVSSQLPMVIRGIYFADWDPSADEKDHRKKKFIERVKKSLENNQSINAENACKAVFQTLNHHLGSSELKEARASLAKPIRVLWPEPEGKQDRSEETQNAVSDEEKEEDQEESEQEKPSAEEASSTQQETSNIHRLSKGEGNEKPSEEKVSEEGLQPQRKEKAMRNQYSDDYENESRDYRGRGYRTSGGYTNYDEGRFTQERPDYNQNRYYGRANMNREYYSDNYNRPYELGDYYGRRSGGLRNSGRENYTSYPRDNNYEIRDYPDQGLYTDEDNSDRYAADNPDYRYSRRGWNEGRPMAGNRQSYGYEDEGRWRSRRW